MRTVTDRYEDIKSSHSRTFPKGAAVLEIVLRKTAVSCCILYESSEKTTFLLYIRQGLEAYLARPEVKGLMERFGYRGWDLEKILSLVSIKYEEHMEDRAGFPHEIGLLLGLSCKGCDRIYRK